MVQHDSNKMSKVVGVLSSTKQAYKRRDKLQLCEDDMNYLEECPPYFSFYCRMTCMKHVEKRVFAISIRLHRFYVSYFKLGSNDKNVAYLKI